MTTHPTPGSTGDAAKPVETFWLERDPLTGEPFDIPGEEDRDAA